MNSHTSIVLCGNWQRQVLLALDVIRGIRHHVRARPHVFSAGQWECEVHGGCSFSKSSHPKWYTKQTEAEIYTVRFASMDCGKVLFSPDFVSEGSKKKRLWDACNNLSWWFELSNLVLLHRPDDLWVISVSFCSLYVFFNKPEGRPPGGKHWVGHHCLPVFKVQKC